MKTARRKIKRRSVYEIVKMYQLRQLGWTMQKIADQFGIYPAVVWGTLNTLTGRLNGIKYRKSYGTYELFNEAYDLAAKIIKKECKV
jgi:hypothetical protein